MALRSLGIRSAIFVMLIALGASCAFASASNPALPGVNSPQVSSVSEPIWPLPPAVKTAAAEPIWPLPPAVKTAAAEPIWPLPPAVKTAAAEPIWPLPPAVS